MKKSFAVFTTALIALIILFLALYAMGIIFGQDIVQVNERRYNSGDYSFTYNGTLLDGKFSGIGELIFSDGSCYSGGFEAGRFHGNAVFTSAEGWRYEGAFFEGQMTGEGIFFAINGDLLTQRPDGSFEFDSIDDWQYIGSLGELGQTGYGRFVFADGAVYEGAFVRGFAEGQGVYQSVDNWSYEGGFVQGLFDGEGILTDSGGKTVVGIWEKGVQVLMR